MSLKLSTVEAIEKIYLLDYGNKNTLIGKPELEILSKKIHPFDNKLEISASHNNIIVEKSLDTRWKLSLNTINIFPTRILSESNIAYRILFMGDGKISFCGVRSFGVLAYQRADKYDLFIHSCSLLEAEELIQECRRISNNTMLYNNKSNKYEILDGRIKIKINCTIFKDREEILSSINCNGSKYGWDPINGFFCTLASGIIFFLGGFPLDRRLTDKEIIRHELYLLPIFCSSNTNSFVEHLGEREVVNIIHDINGVSLFDGTIGIKIFTSRVNVDINAPLTYYIPKQRIYPTITEYFGKDYISTFVGINNDRYVAFANIKQPFDISNDIFRLLCSYWLKIEIDDTYTKLLLPV